MCKADLKAAMAPEFIALAAEFHAAAGQLAREAADAQDVALFAQTCVACHGTYASDRFPALATE
jgi:cytochrome c553